MKKFLIIASILVILIVGALISPPHLIKAINAKYKSTDHFASLENDTRIHYEPGAKPNAIALKAIIDDVAAEVEDTLGVKFNRDLDAYICATQESFNEYVYLSKNARGAVYWEKIFLSPGAFQPGFLKQLILHESTHYLFISYLGDRANIQNIPLWFREGIAVYVADGASEYIIRSRAIYRITEPQKTAYLSGDYDLWFSTNDPAQALNKAGSVDLNRYRMAGYMVHYMEQLDSQKFKQLIKMLVAGKTFDDSLLGVYNKKMDALIEGFGLYLHTF